MVSRQAKYKKKRYAEDPEYRKKLCEISRSYWAANKDEFNARRRTRLRTEPEYRKKLCESSRSYWAANKDEISAHRRARRQTDPEYRKRQQRYRARRYGLSGDDYDALLALQGGVCAICRKNRPLGVDHCHLFNEVRGLLCNKCNLGLGMFDDDPDRLRAAADYLERSRRAPLSKRRQSIGKPATTSTRPTERRSVTSPRKPARPGRPGAASGRSSNGTPGATPLGRRKTK
jgi:hypothetical protein